MLDLRSFLLCYRAFYLSHVQEMATQKLPGLDLLISFDVQGFEIAHAGATNFRSKNEI